MIKVSGLQFTIAYLIATFFSQPNHSAIFPLLYKSQVTVSAINMKFLMNGFVICYSPTILNIIPCASKAHNVSPSLYIRRLLYIFVYCFYVVDKYMVFNTVYCEASATTYPSLISP